MTTIWLIQQHHQQYKSNCLSVRTSDCFTDRSWRYTTLPGLHSQPGRPSPLGLLRLPPTAACRVEYLCWRRSSRRQGTARRPDAILTLPPGVGQLLRPVMLCSGRRSNSLSSARRRHKLSRPRRIGSITALIYSAAAAAMVPDWHCSMMLLQVLYVLALTDGISCDSCNRAMIRLITHRVTPTLWHHCHVSNALMSAPCLWNWSG